MVSMEKCDFLSVTFAVSATVSKIFRLKVRKMLILPTPPIFDAPGRGGPLIRISGLNLASENKTESWGYQIVKKS